MKRSAIHNALFFGVIIFFAPQAMAQGKGGNKFTPLMATLNDTLNVISDSNGPYAAKFSTGYFQLDLDTGRTMKVGFGDCEPGSDCSKGLAGWIPIFQADQPVLNSMSQIESVPPGTGTFTRFRIRFKDSTGQKWVLRFFGDAESCGTDEPTGLVYAFRESDTGWSITAPTGSVGCLLKISTSRGKESYTASGRYIVPFSLLAVK